jgi:hypothetical protein
LNANPGKVQFQWQGGDPEVSQFAGELRKLFGASTWTVLNGTALYTPEPFVGVGVFYHGESANPDQKQVMVSPNTPLGSAVLVLNLILQPNGFTSVQPLPQQEEGVLTIMVGYNPRPQ